MGVMGAMKAANMGYWADAVVAAHDGDGGYVGYLDSAKALDNRTHQVKVTAVGHSDTVFGEADIDKIDLVAATGEWVRYKICLKNGVMVIATFMALTTDGKGNKRTNMHLLNFEWWYAEKIYR